MVTVAGRVDIAYSDPRVNDALGSCPGSNATVERRFSQNEELFLELPEEYEVPSYAVHHDVSTRSPSADVEGTVVRVVTRLTGIVPELLSGLTHIFDPTRIHAPAFFRLYRHRDTTYLYLLRLDLSFRAKHARLIDRSSNRTTAHYATRRLYLESDLLPLRAVETRDERVTAMALEQSISETWIGETGRGYLRQGVWLDRDLTRFLSYLFLPAGSRLYPYFPFTCKYRTIAHATTAITERERLAGVSMLHSARALVLPHIRGIEESLRRVARDGFNDELPAFVALKQTVGPQWESPWSGWSVERYLNKEDEREFRLHQKHA